LDSFGSEYRSVEGYCEYVDTHVFHKIRGIPEQLNDYWFLHAGLQRTHQNNFFNFYTPN